MNASLYVTKATLLLSTGETERAVSLLKNALRWSEEDRIGSLRAHSLLGQYFFIRGDYQAAREHLRFIVECAGEAGLADSNDPDSEIQTAHLLMRMIETFSL